MKNNFKFVVAVFGLTIATFGSMKSNALPVINDDVRCVEPYTGGCVKMESGKWLTGTRQDI